MTLPPLRHRDIEDLRDGALAIAMAVAQDWGIDYRPTPWQRIQAWQVVRDYADQSIRAAVAAIPVEDLDWDEIAEMLNIGAGQARRDYQDPPDPAIKLSRAL